MSSNPHAQVRARLLADGYTKEEADYCIERDPFLRLEIAKMEFMQAVTDAFRPVVDRIERAMRRGSN